MIILGYMIFTQFYPWVKPTLLPTFTQFYPTGFTQWVKRTMPTLALDQEVVGFRLLAIPLSCIKPRQVVHTHAHTCTYVTKQYNLVAAKRAVMLCSNWPCVTDSVVYPPTGSMSVKGDEHPCGLPNIRLMLVLFIVLPLM